MSRPTRAALGLALAVGLGACGAGKSPLVKINGVPAPGVYQDGTVDLSRRENPLIDLPYDGVLCATARELTKRSGSLGSSPAMSA